MTEEEYKALNDFEKMIKSCTTEEFADWLLPEVMVQEEEEERLESISLEESL